MARDLAAAGLGALRSQIMTPAPGKFRSPIGVSIELPASAASACAMFAGRVIRGVRNGPSPQWLQNRLKSVGLRPISAIVDVTNYIAHGWGRPLHAFDAARVNGDMRARVARHGETLLALDGKTYISDCEMLVIADARACR